ncbi:uncharacterized protein LODBEIA_P49730 [Lodderomyces beijingensis]|uniref:Septation protein imp2 n=1 Tax=Lodderomyces beijingensis TaxID=1775926 RepID=A0ABP0ZRI7_9ASCO
MRISDHQDNHIDFVNNFWGSSPESSFQIVSTRIRDSQATLTEVVNFYSERTNIEQEYIRKLEKLQAKCPLGAHETGSMKKSLDKLGNENQAMINHGVKFVRSIQSTNIEKLQHFQQLYAKKVDKLRNHMNKVLARRASALKEVAMFKRKYQEECSMIKSLKLSLQTTWGKELDKNQQKFNKLSTSVNQTRNNYQLALRSFKDINEIFKRDWTISINDFYKLEIERIQILKVNCFTYCNNIATLCVDIDQAIDVARSTFATVQPQADVQEFSDNYGTGNKIYNDPEFVDYMAGSEETPPSYIVSSLSNPGYKDILARANSSYSQGTSRSQPRTPYSQTSEVFHKDKDEDEEEQPLQQQQQQQQQQSSSLEMTPRFSPAKVAAHTATTLSPSSPLKELHTNGKNHFVTPVKNTIYESLPFRAERASQSQTPSRKPPVDLMSRKTQSTASSGPENDVFSKDERMSYSNGSGSNYSSERNWASPRRKEKQLHQIQDQISRRATNDFGKSRATPSRDDKVFEQQQQQPKVPIVNDFSIDFIAKALEDLNSGGDGDVNQFRRSVRSENGNQPTPSPTKRPKSDYIDDHDEVAHRHESITFRRPKSMDFDSMMSMTAGSTKKFTFDPHQKSPYAQKNYFQSSCASASAGSSPRNRPVRQSVRLTPSNGKPYVSTAIARYTFRPSQEGELFFRKGWQMYIIHKQEDNWFVAELGPSCDEYAGMIGLVPGNYLVER